MRGYDRYEYEDLDEYEEDGEEEGGGGEEEYEQEEDPQPTKEVLDYLELRQRLKEEKRKKLNKELGAGSSREKKNVIPKPKDNYGSFFGPSQPVIAQRVIQESKSLLENPNLAARVMKSNQTVNKSTGSAPAGSKPQANGQIPKVTKPLQTKVQMLKNTRDYSFLLSDDTEVPAPSKDPPRNVFPPKSEACTAQLPERSKEMLSNNGRKVLNSREDKKPTPTVSRVQHRVGNERSVSTEKHNRALVDSRKMLSGSSRTLADPRKQHSSSNGSGPGRPVVSKGVPSKIPGGTAEKRVGVPLARPPSTSGIQKPAPSKSHHPVSKPSLIRKGESLESRKPNAPVKQMVPPPKPKVSQPLPRNSTRAVPVDDRPRKKPRRHDDDDDVDNAISEIRKMFGYNPRRYADDDDDSDMEANFDDIMREEKRSAKIARREDEEELRKIEEEERREQLRREAKRRKMMR